MSGYAHPAYYGPPAYPGAVYTESHGPYSAPPVPMGAYAPYAEPSTARRAHAEQSQQHFPGGFVGAEDAQASSIPFAYSEGSSHHQNITPNDSPPTSSGGKGSPGPPSTGQVRSERSATPAEPLPQKRTGKLPASGEAPSYVLDCTPLPWDFEAQLLARDGAVTTTLRTWLLAHTTHPYPSE